MFGYKTYRFSLAITRDQLMAVYQGSIKRFRVTTIEGLVLDLDASHFRNFTTNEGISGVFELTTTSENKFVKITKIS
ncbi:MAG: DUF2835 family protein [Succinivibrio sp.]